MDTTRRTAEDIQHVEGIVKKDPDYMAEDFPTEPNPQTAKRTIPQFQELAIYAKEWEIHKTNLTFLEVRK